MTDPKKLRDDLQIIRRSGVEIDNVIDAVLNPVQIYPARTDSNGNRSVKLRGYICAVTVNPDSGIMIQTNPLKEAHDKNVRRYTEVHTRESTGSRS